MRLKNILIVVNDIEKSKAFYKELFGLDVVTDLGGNIILTEGLVLQERGLWEQLIGKAAVYGGRDAELYFEESDMDGFLEKLDKCGHDIEYLTPCEMLPWGQRVIRLYDLDRHLIEIREFVNNIS